MSHWGCLVRPSRGVNFGFFSSQSQIGLKQPIFSPALLGDISFALWLPAIRVGPPGDLGDIDGAISPARKGGWDEPSTEHEDCQLAPVPFW